MLWAVVLSLCLQDRKPLFDLESLPELVRQHLEEIPEIKDIKDDNAKKVIAQLVLQAGYFKSSWQVLIYVA